MAEVVRELAAKLSLQVDKSSFKAGDKAMGQTKQQLGGISSGLSSIRSLLPAIGMAAAGMAAKKAFVDFNSSIEQSVISMAAIQKMFKGGDWQDQMQVASGLVEHYQQVAKASVGETRDFIEMHKGIAASAYQAGASLDDLKEITKGAVIASSAMGESAIVSAMDLKQALSKGVSVRDRFMVNLLASQKMTAAQFNKLTKEQRVETLKKLLTADWIKDAAKQMEFSFEGVLSTLKDTLSITFGKIGLPLFKQITEQIKQWNVWLEKNPKNVFFDTIGHGISEATAGFKLMGGAIAAVTGLLQELNNGFKDLRAAFGAQSAIVKVFEAIANPIREAYETLRDLIDFMSGKASLLGLAMADDKAAYVAHARKGGRFGLRGEILAPGAAGGVSGAKASIKSAATSTGLGKSASDFANAVKSGKTMDAIQSGALSILNLGALGPEMIGRGATWGAGRVFGGSSPWQAAPYSPDVKVSGESMTSMGPPGGWAPPPPVLASGLGAPPVKMSGEMKVNIKVEATADTKVTSESHSTELRASGAMYSSEP